MVFRKHDALVALTVIVFFGEPLIGQNGNAARILDVAENTQAAFITTTMDQGFPIDRADQMTMLILNRSAITLPLIEERVIQTFKSKEESNGQFIGIASEMIAYAGDEHSLRVIGRLIALDENRFGILVGRTLDNALDRRNPFLVAYSGFEFGDKAISRRIVEWSERVLASNRMRRLWGEAVIGKYGRVPSKAEWASDPLASRLSQSDADSLRSVVLRFAEEARSKR